MMIWIFFAITSISYGFHVDKNSPVRPNSQDQNYITAAEFNEYKQKQHNEIEKITTLLMSHLQPESSSVLHGTMGGSESNRPSSTPIKWFQKYYTLERNHAKLQSSFNKLFKKYSVLEHRLSSVLNMTLEMNEILSSPPELRNTQDPQDLHALQEQVKTIGAKLFILDSNDKVRNHDIFTLYNRTGEINSMIKDFEMQTNKELKNLERIQNETVETFQNQCASNGPNVSFLDLGKRIELVESNHNSTVVSLSKQIQEYQFKQNVTEERIMQRVSQANEKVAVTTCVSVDGVVHHNNAIRFDQVRSHVGILDMAAIRTTGKFTCEKGGVYHISVVINTPTDHASFSIYMNGNSVSKLSISSDSHVDTGTSVVALELQIGDIVWVQADTDTHVYFHWSCMTVVKL
ncbi:unnamed protein product [Mytilus coruscus]|uniref:C1q domain-containing protein n=1 Tax=Mytilus coruscus TaxID=42192 RepID=A0A6J7ZUQ7_MYTCO|nr:unnamed protein product [Mytilus coruscus]